MSREEKIIKKWKKAKGSKQEVELNEVFIVLNGSLKKYLVSGHTTGSHLYKIQHPALESLKGTIEGIFTIPVHNKKIKRQWIDRLVKAYELIKQEEAK